MRSMSKNNDSLWVKLGGEGFETRVVNGILQIKARSAMLGYLMPPVLIPKMAGSILGMR